MTGGWMITKILPSCILSPIAKYGLIYFSTTSMAESPSMDSIKV